MVMWRMKRGCLFIPKVPYHNLNARNFHLLRSFPFSLLFRKQEHNGDNSTSSSLPQARMEVMVQHLLLQNGDNGISFGPWTLLVEYICALHVFQAPALADVLLDKVAQAVRSDAGVNLVLGVTIAKLPILHARHAPFGQGLCARMQHSKDVASVRIGSP